MKSFNLFGKVFSISDDRDTYNLLHKKYCENANRAYEEYTEKYRKLGKIEFLKVAFDFNGISMEIDKRFEIGVDIIKRHINDSLIIFQEYSLSNVDYGIFIKKYLTRKYRSIDETYRKVLPDRIFNKIDKNSPEEKRISVTLEEVNQILEDPKTLQALADSVYNDVKNIHYAIIDALEDNGIKKYKYILQSDENKAICLFNNLKDSPLSKDKILDTMLEILELYPYNIEYFTFLIDTYNDEKREIEAIAEYFGVDVIEYKYSLLKKYYDTIPVATLEELNEAKEKVIKYSGLLGMKADVSAEGKKILDEIDAHIFKFKINMAMSIFDSLPKNTEEEALSSKEKIIAYCKEIGLPKSNSVIEKMDTIIKQIDKNIRTVEGIEFETREQAYSAKDEKSIIEEIIAKHEQIRRADIITLIDEIRNLSFKTDIKDIYIRRFEKNLKDFDKNYKKAARHDYRIKKNSRIYSGDKKDFLIHLAMLIIPILSCISDADFLSIAIGYTGAFMAYIFLYKRKKEKEAWEQLTHNSRYEFSDLM